MCLSLVKGPAKCALTVLCNYYILPETMLYTLEKSVFSCIKYLNAVIKTLHNFATCWWVTESLQTHAAKPCSNPQNCILNPSGDLKGSRDDKNKIMHQTSKVFQLKNTLTYDCR